jgi:serine/threonine-protein kinase HipA
MSQREFRHAVLLHDREVGLLHQRGDYVRFEFVPTYWEDPNRNVLGLWFENNPGATPSAALRLPAWFSNLLPEGQLREWIARDRRVSPDREMQLLLQVGHDLPGAVAIVPEEGAPLPWRADTASEARGGLIGGERIKFSLAGVGLKFSMMRQGERFTIPASGVAGQWIVKMPDPAHVAVPENEYAMMSLAREVGISVPEVHLVHRDDLSDLPDRVWPAGENYALAVRRFDREAQSRIHIEDFAQVRGFYGGGAAPDKYSGSFETVAALCYRGRDISSLREFARRFAFNVAIGNGDAHLKNWSLIYPDGRRAVLSPAYDLVSTAPYLGAAEEDLGMAWGGSHRLDTASAVPFERLERKLGATDAGLADVAHQTIQRLRDALPAKELLPDRLSFVARWLSDSIRGALTRF